MTTVLAEPPDAILLRVRAQDGVRWLSQHGRHSSSSFSMS